MRRRGVHVTRIVLAAVVLLSGIARADERVLYTAPALSAADAASVAEALHVRHGVEPVDEASARVLLTEQAAALPPDRVAESTAAAIDEAEAGWADLRLDAARATLDHALAQLMAAPRPPPTALVARALFVRSLVDGAAGRRAEAARALDAALALDTTLTPSPDRHGPPVARAVEEARRRGRAAPDAALRITVAPGDAHVAVDGAAASGHELRVATGPHLVVAERPGYRPGARLLEVAGEADVAITLEPAPAALAAAQILVALEAGAAYRDLAFVAARALGVSRVFEAVPGTDGVTVQVWSAAGERLSTLPDPRRAAPPPRAVPAAALHVEEPTPSRAWLWVGGGAVVVVVAVAAVLLFGSQEPEVANRLTVTGP